jgi:hypothetical protein
MYGKDGKRRQKKGSLRRINASRRTRGRGVGEI